MLIDSHCHIHLFDKSIWGEVVLDAFRNEISYILNVAISLDNITDMRFISDLDKRVFSSIGIHPCNVNDIEFDLAKRTMLSILEKEFSNIYSVDSGVKDFSNLMRIVALGETGLDLYHSQNNINKQIEFFELHIELSKKYNIPVIIHSRNADKEMIEFLKANKHKQFKGVMHSFASSEKLCKTALDCGLFISFSGIVTIKSATDISEIAKNYVPDDMILSETDSPYLIPRKARKLCKTGVNHPKFVKYVVEHLSNIRQDNLLMPKIKNNFEKLFFTQKMNLL